MADILDPSFIQCYQNHRQSVNWLSFSPDSNYLASASDDKTIILWNLSRSNVCYKYTGHIEAVTTVALTNSFMISGSKDYTARLWRLSDQNEGVIYSDSSIYRCHQSPIRCVDINADESQFCTSSDDKTVKIWSTTSTNKFISSLSNEHTNWVRHARFSKLSPFLLSSCGDDGLICIWDIRSREAAIKLNSKRRSYSHVLGIQWHPNCEYIMSSSSADFSIKIWDLRYEKSVQCYQVHDGFVNSTDFHSSGNYLISSSVDQTCKIIDLYEGRTLFTLRAHTGQVNCAQFSPNGEHFASAGQDRGVLLWKSNLPGLADYCSDDDDDVRSIASFVDAPPINAFDADEVKSIRSRIGAIKNEANQSQVTIKREISDIGISREVYTPLTKPAVPYMAPNDSLNIDKNCVNIMKSILQQLGVITDSILDIDKRLTTMEKKVENRPEM